MKKGKRPPPLTELASWLIAARPDKELPTAMLEASYAIGRLCAAIEDRALALRVITDCMVFMHEGFDVGLNGPRKRRRR